MLTTFQLITLDFWEDVYNKVSVYKNMYTDIHIGAMIVT